MQHENAVAGPSMTSYPVVFPPPYVAERVQAHSAPPSSPRLKKEQYLRTTDDLVARFGLLDDYVKFVTRGFGTEPNSIDENSGEGTNAGEGTTPPAAETPGPATTPSSPEKSGTQTIDKKDKRAKATYKLLIQQIPGKHSFKKEDYLIPIMNPASNFGLMNPDFFGPPQIGTISQSNGDGSIRPWARTTLEAFNVSADGLKGWNPSALVVESAQAKEDRKRRKELKKLAKAQQAARAAQAQAQAQAGTQNPPTNVTSSSAAASPRSTVPPSYAGTPRPQPLAGVKRQRTDSMSSNTPRPSTPIMQAGTPRAAKKPKLEKSIPVSGVA